MGDKHCLVDHENCAARGALLLAHEDRQPKIPLSLELEVFLPIQDRLTVNTSVKLMNGIKMITHLNPGNLMLHLFQELSSQIGDPIKIYITLPRGIPSLQYVQWKVGGAPSLVGHHQFLKMSTNLQ